MRVRRRLVGLLQFRKHRGLGLLVTWLLDRNCAPSVGTRDQFESRRRAPRSRGVIGRSVTSRSTRTVTLSNRGQTYSEVTPTFFNIRRRSTTICSSMSCSDGASKVSVSVPKVTL